MINLSKDDITLIKTALLSLLGNSVIIPEDMRKKAEELLVRLSTMEKESKDA